MSSAAASTLLACGSDASNDDSQRQATEPATPDGTGSMDHNSGGAPSTAPGGGMEPSPDEPGDVPMDVPEYGVPSLPPMAAPSGTATMPRLFREAGYWTGAVGKVFHKAGEPKDWVAPKSLAASMMFRGSTRAGRVKSISGMMVVTPMAALKRANNGKQGTSASPGWISPAAASTWRSGAGGPSPARSSCLRAGRAPTRGPTDGRWLWPAPRAMWAPPTSPAPRPDERPKVRRHPGRGQRSPSRGENFCRDQSTNGSMVVMVPSGSCCSAVTFTLRRCVRSVSCVSW